MLKTKLVGQITFESVIKYVASNGELAQLCLGTSYKLVLISNLTFNECVIASITNIMSQTLFQSVSYNFGKSRHYKDCNSCSNK